VLGSQLLKLSVALDIVSAVKRYTGQCQFDCYVKVLSYLLLYKLYYEHMVSKVHQKNWFQSSKYIFLKQCRNLVYSNQQKSPF